MPVPRGFGGTGICYIWTNLRSFGQDSAFAIPYNSIGRERYVMEWLTCIKNVIAYIEENLSEDITVEDMARQVFVSPYLLQRGFSALTGCTPGEYLRNRRLYQAALALRDTDERVIDIALRYAYETPESFTKAFTRFHGATPSQVRAGRAAFRTFLPFKISVSIQGGNQMQCKIVRMFPLKVIGFQKIFSYEEAQTAIPRFWDEICERYAASVYAGNPPRTPQEQALVDNCVGEYGVCIDDLCGGRFRYLIAGKYCGGSVPGGMTLYEFPMGEWAVFDCIGAIPEALQTLNTRIFKEWLPGNGEYELAGCANVEWYDCMNGEKSDPDYHSAIWLPVRRKQ